jgi:hypothetical protein
MYHYVNHQSINDLFKPLEVETDPRARLNLIKGIKSEVIDKLVNQIAITCFELKVMGWSTGQIAEAFDISERKVKALIKYHSDKTSSHNPLVRHKASDIVDISYLVTKSGVELASPPSPTPPLA